MKRKQIFLSVIIPAFNEVDRLPLMLIDIDYFLSRQNYSYEIIVVNNSSTDGTKIMAKKFSSLIRNLKLINLDKNYHRGGGIRAGMLVARGRWRLALDADNSTKIEELAKIKDFLGDEDSDYQIFVGSRYLRDSQINIDINLSKKIFEKFLSYWYRLLKLVRGIKDVHCGFKCFSSDVAVKVFSLSKINDCGNDIEVLALAQALGFKIKEVPVCWSHDSKSKVSLIDYWKILCHTFKIRKKIWNII